MSSTKKTATQIWANYSQIIGPSKALPSADLPTLRDILQQVLLLKESRSTQDISVSVFQEVASLVIAIWKRANALLIETDVRISDKTIADKISFNWDSISSQMQKRKAKKKTGRWTKESFSDRLDRLFNILHCRCPFISCETAKCITDNCIAAHISCSCPLKTKV